MYKVIDNVIDLGLESAVWMVQEQALEEGNTSITPDKYNIRTSEGLPLIILWEGKVAGFCLYEPSHYTGDPDVAVRICRLHILKEYRHNQLGFYFWDHSLKLAKKDGYKIQYMTHDINAHAMNSLYQHRRRVPGHSNEPYELDSFKSITLDKRMLFDVDPGSGFLQYVYYVDVQNEGYDWQPKTNIIWREHDGKL